MWNIDGSGFIGFMWNNDSSGFIGFMGVSVQVNVKIKVTLEQSTNAQKGSRDLKPRMYRPIEQMF
jgi:hypothetical protein